MAMYAENVKVFGRVGHENNPDPRSFKKPQENKAPAGRSVSFEDYCLQNTGKYMNGENFAKSYYASEDLRQQSEDIARRLEPFLERDGKPSLMKKSDKVLITHCTGQIIEVPEFANNNFLPYMAAKNRNQMGQGLEYHLENEARTGRDGKVLARYLTCTFGKRVRIHQASRRADKAKATLSYFMEECKRRFGTQFFFVGWEYTIDRKKTIHWHANVVYENPFFMDGGAAFLEFCNEFEESYGMKSSDNGRLQNIHEVCKYPFKPVELNKLDDAELYELFKFSYRRRYFEMLGSAKRMRAQHKKEKLRYGKVNDRVVLRQTSCLFERTFDDIQEPNEEREPRKTPENILLCSVAPSFAFGMWSEGATLVWNYNPRSMGEESQIRLSYLRHISAPYREEWERKQCPHPETAKRVSEAAKSSWLNDETYDVVEALWEGDFRARRSYVPDNGTISPESSQSFKEHPPNDDAERGFLSIFDLDDHEIYHERALNEGKH